MAAAETSITALFARYLFLRRQSATLHVIFVEDLFRHSIGRAIVPARVIVAIEQDGDDDA